MSENGISKSDQTALDKMRLISGQMNAALQSSNGGSKLKQKSKRRKSKRRKSKRRKSKKRKSKRR